jgi:hypothetical protein
MNFRAKRAELMWLVGLLGAVSVCWLFTCVSRETPPRVVVERDVSDIRGLGRPETHDQAKTCYDPYFTRENHFPKLNLPTVGSPIQTN